MNHIGIDPGANGAFAFYQEGAGFVVIEDLPTNEDGLFDARMFFEMLHALPGPISAALERPLPFTMNNADSILKLGASYGALRALLATRDDLTLHTPTPRSWKAKLGLTSDKKESVLRAREALGADAPKRLRHDKAEAVMLTQWSRQNAGELLESVDEMAARLSRGRYEPE